MTSLHIAAAVHHNALVPAMQRQISPDSACSVGEINRRKQLKVGGSFVHSNNTSYIQKEPRWRICLKSFLSPGMSKVISGERIAIDELLCAALPVAVPDYLQGTISCQFSMFIRFESII